MIPVVTPDEMRRVDERAIASGVPLEVLVERAGWAVARTARNMLGGTYGRRVVVVVGPGNNGADGRVAARLLGERGVAVRLVDATDLPARLPDADLVIDAAFGTGFAGSGTLRRQRVECWRSMCRVVSTASPVADSGHRGRVNERSLSPPPNPDTSSMKDVDRVESSRSPTSDST